MDDFLPPKWPCFAPSIWFHSVQQPDPNQPRPEGAQMIAIRGEPLGVVTNWPPSLEAALQRWGTISPKAPCLTTMDTNGKPLYVLTYGNITIFNYSHSYNDQHLHTNILEQNSNILEQNHIICNTFHTHKLFHISEYYLGLIQ